jgi:hypothetical protein
MSYLSPLLLSAIALLISIGALLWMILRQPPSRQAPEPPAPPATDDFDNRAHAFMQHAPAPPPQQPVVREPLTDAEISEEIVERGVMDVAWPSQRRLNQFARAIERAHGIGIKGGQHGTE